jgi:hypothetical protein
LKCDTGYDDPGSLPCAAEPLGHQLFLKWKCREQLISGFSDENLLLELDTLGTTIFTDIALKTDRHVLLKNTIIADTWKIFWIENDKAN